MNLKLTLKLILILGGIFYLLDILMILIFYFDELPPIQGFLFKALESIFFGILMAFAYQYFYRKKINILCENCSTKQEKYVFPKNWFYVPDSITKCKNCGISIKIETEEAK